MAENYCVTFLWKIENFYYCAEEEGECLRSPEFYVNALSESAWELQVYPTCSDDENDIKVYLHNNYYTKSSELFIDYEISFLSVEGSSLVSSKEQNIEINGDTSYGVSTYPTQEDVLDSREKEFLPQGTLTIQCRIWKARKILKQPIVYFARTRIGFQRRSFYWAIQEFKKLKLNHEKRTKVFIMGKHQPAFSLELSLTGTILNKASIDIEIKQLTDNIPTFFSTCRISVLDIKGRVLKWFEDYHWFTAEKRTWNYPPFLTRSELIERKTEYLVGDVLNLVFDLTFSTGFEYSNIESISSMPSWISKSIGDYFSSSSSQCLNLDEEQRPVAETKRGKFLGVLELDLLSLYKDGNFSDFELRSGDATFPVHRLVLADRSPVFKAMFTSGMREREDNFLDIPDMDGDTLQRLLLFVYTGNVEDLDWSSASKLYYAADKYEVLSLKQKCSALLKANITVSNACDILVLSDRHRDEELKTLVHDFMVLNDKDIIRSDEWKRLMEHDIQLASETMYLMYSKRLDMPRGE